jgi:hypothetical protein
MPVGLPEVDDVALADPAMPQFLRDDLPVFDVPSLGLGERQPQALGEEGVMGFPCLTPAATGQGAPTRAS